MPVTIETLPRVFAYKQLRLPDPDPAMTPEQVKASFAANYPELTNAAIEGPFQETGPNGLELKFKFSIKVGTNG